MVHRFFCEIPLSEGVVPLPDGLRHHACNVLRMRKGEPLILCDGKGHDAECRLLENGTAEVISISDCPEQSKPSIHIYPSVSKGERFEWLLQKSVELGVTDITPVLSSRCIAAAPEDKKLMRWQKIIRAAAEQSGRGRIPRLHGVVNFDVALEKKSGLLIFCYEGGGDVSLKVLLGGNFPDSISVLTGPEGGYSHQEAELCKNQGWQAVSLGRRILRCETAPLFVLSAIGYELM
ncbi:MAG: 16S rRNA (uracil(1498)-N(3))-methyltransferase [Oscillospiraceae bacterium]|nr:16S rRNA (uracil(1498)-N(3))-methyltransferase [Oscillospiraceae bacterium]